MYVVFGATGGIGSELCKRLAAQDGAQLVVAGRDGDKVQRLVDSLDGGASVLAHTVDPLNGSEVDKCVAEAVSRFGRVDGVANCVGSVLLKAAHTTSEAEFEEVIRTNLFSSFHILKASAKAMMRSGGGGAIVFCSSAVAKHGIQNHEAIAAAKVGRCARPCACMWGMSGVRCRDRGGFNSPALFTACLSHASQLLDAHLLFPSHHATSPPYCCVCRGGSLLWPSVQPPPMPPRASVSTA